MDTKLAIAIEVILSDWESISDDEFWSKMDALREDSMTTELMKMDYRERENLVNGFDADDEYEMAKELDAHWGRSERDYNG